jgi:hypothetical protein
MADFQVLFRRRGVDEFRKYVHNLVSLLHDAAQNEEKSEENKNS